MHTCEYLGAGATGLAAILQGLLPELKGKKSDKMITNICFLQIFFVIES